MATAPGPARAPWRLAGIDARTPDPPDGRIERELDGSPQGTLHEGAANLVGVLLPALSVEERLAGLLLAQQHMHARGITAWQDAIVGDYLGSPDPLPVYLAAAASGQLTARVEGALWWDRTRGGEQLPDILTRRERGRGAPVPREHREDHAGRRRGELHRRNARALSRPDRLPRPRQRPVLRGPGSRCASYVTQLDALGFQVHLHAIGDRAVREALDAIEAARTAKRPSKPAQGQHHRDNRHHIAHLQVVHPDDVPRFAALDVTANMQGLWAAHEPQMDELTIPFIGPERTQRQYVFGDLLRSGARLAAGSDWAVSSANPLRAIHVAVNRSLAGSDRSAGRAVPAESAAGPGRGARGVHDRLGVREPPR